MQNFGTRWVILYSEFSNEDDYWVLITSNKELSPLWYRLVVSPVACNQSSLLLLQESSRLSWLSNTIILIGLDDQFADLVILSFFLTADHLDGLSWSGGPLRQILPPPLNIPTQLSASAYRAVLGYQQAPQDSLVVQGP